MVSPIDIYNAEKLIILSLHLGNIFNLIFLKKLGIPKHFKSMVVRPITIYFLIPLHLDVTLNTNPIFLSLLYKLTKTIMIQRAISIEFNILFHSIE